MKERDWAEYWRQLIADRQQAGVPVAEAALEEEEIDLESVLDRDISRGQLPGLVENLFADAARVGASNIHIVPRGPRQTQVLFTVDGQLSLWYTIEDSRAESVIAVVKSRCVNLDRYERLAAQDGSAQKLVDNQLIRYRVSALPVLSREVGTKFESLVIKVRKNVGLLEGIDNLGLDPRSLRSVRDGLERGRGLVIVVGTGGSGKSTTLVAALQSVMKPTQNVITVEDPVKYIIDGVRQIKLRYKLGFVDALQAILRHDPDMVLLGEIRDRAQADVAIRLAITGHLTFTTMQARDALSAIVRLYTLGVEPFLITQGINLVIAQRLLRKVCERCKEPVPHVNDRLLARLGFMQEEAEYTRFFRAVSCINCIGGYKGRVPIFESLQQTPEIEEAILNCWDGLHTEAIHEAAIRQGIRPLRDSGIDLLKKGITTIEEVAIATS